MNCPDNPIMPRRPISTQMHSYNKGSWQAILNERMMYL